MYKSIICIFAIFFLGCATSYGRDVMPKSSIETYFHLPIKEQIKDFNRHSLNEQYQLFLYGNQVVEPPAIYLAQPFAEQGSGIVPFLSQKLGESKDEITIRDITQVFLEMSRLRLYDFSQDKQLLNLLSSRASKMNGIWRAVTLENIAALKMSK